MALLIRTVNVFFAALFLVMVMVSFAFLQAGRDGLARAGGNIWISLGWAASFMLLAAFCFANLRYAAEAQDRASRLAVGRNLAAAALAAAGLLHPDPIMTWMAALAIVPFAVTAGAILIGARRGDDAG